MGCSRVIFRILHFVIYAFLFIAKFAKIKLHYHLNTLRWVFLLALNRLDTNTILQSCTTGNRLGTKVLSHTAIVINNFEVVNNNPPLAQMTKLAELISWLLISQSADTKSQGSKMVTLYDKNGVTD